MTMRAMRLERPGDELALVELPIPTPGPGQVRVRVHACGVSRTATCRTSGGPSSPDTRSWEASTAAARV
jgi:NADPH:quinone reductase-like Zn-dependent oxidoreductase